MNACGAAGGAAPGWAAALSAGAPAQLVARVVRLAAARWVDARRVRSVLADLLAQGGSPDADALLSALEQLHHHDGPAGGGAGAHNDDAAAETAAAALLAVDARVLVVGAAGYPAQLTAAWPELGAPPWLFTAAPHGRLPEASAVAVVGTRRPTLDGLAIARQLGRLLAEHGVTVISGMARGIDQAAHQGALDVGGATVAVLGTGLDVDYPARDGALRAAVAHAGGLVTEYLPGVGPRPAHFLWRNRIISGLADATVVVEGRARSGALQTARLAAAQGREVLAVPGSLNLPTSRGPLDLIRDGARPVTRLADVLEVVDAGTAAAQTTLPLSEGDDQRHDPDRGALGAHARAVLDLLGATPASTGNMAAATGLPVARVLAAVGELTACGLAEHTPRGVVSRGAVR